MDIKKKKIIKIILIIILILIILLLWLLFSRGKTLSKYKQNINGSSTTEVAQPVFVVDGASDILIDGIEDTIYNFSVKNYDKTSISEVDMNYYIEIVNNSQANLEFILIKDGKNVSLNNNKTNLISLKSLTKQNDEYQLSIKYNNNPAVTSDIDGNVQIKVEAVQIEK